MSAQAEQIYHCPKCDRPQLGENAQPHMRRKRHREVGCPGSKQKPIIKASHYLVTLRAAWRDRVRNFDEALKRHAGDFQCPRCDRFLSIQVSHRPDGWLHEVQARVDLKCVRADGGCGLVLPTAHQIPPSQSEAVEQVQFLRKTMLADLAVMGHQSPGEEKT